MRVAGVLLPVSLVLVMSSHRGHATQENRGPVSTTGADWSGESDREVTLLFHVGYWADGSSHTIAVQKGWNGGDVAQGHYSKCQGDAHAKCKKQNNQVIYEKKMNMAVTEIFANGTGFYHKIEDCEVELACGLKVKKFEVP